MAAAQSSTSAMDTAAPLSTSAVRYAHAGGLGALSFSCPVPAISEPLLRAPIDQADRAVVLAHEMTLNVEPIVQFSRSLHGGMNEGTIEDLPAAGGRRRSLHSPGPICWRMMLITAVHIIVHLGVGDGRSTRTHHGNGFSIACTYYKLGRPPTPCLRSVLGCDISPCRAMYGGLLLPAFRFLPRHAHRLLPRVPGRGG
jgi:hypothetical protein